MLCGIMLNIIKVSVVLPNATILAVIIPKALINIMSTVVLPNAIVLVVIIPNDLNDMLCHYAKYHYAHCYSAECHNAGCHFAELL
jgi:hypothetical protein